jgi:TATA-box binding protein (TBP) (component of TFIID and TFIIIB)
MTGSILKTLEFQFGENRISLDVTHMILRARITSSFNRDTICAAESIFTKKTIHGTRALVTMCEDNKIKVIVGRTGIVVCQMAESIVTEQSIHAATQQVISILSKYMQINAPKIQCMTCIGKYNRECNLQRMVDTYREDDMHYNPNDFPPLTKTFPEGGAIILYASGNFVIAGAKSEERIKYICEWMYDRLL